MGAVLDPWSANVTGCAGEWTKLRGAGAAEGQWPGGATEVQLISGQGQRRTEMPPMI